jgi:hypothetical protein
MYVLCWETQNIQSNESYQASKRYIANPKKILIDKERNNSRENKLGYTYILISYNIQQ